MTISLVLRVSFYSYTKWYKTSNQILDKMSVSDRAEAFNEITHSATRRHSNVVTTSLRTSQRRRSYVSNETPNNVSVERHQVVSVVRLLNILMERRDDVSRGRNNDFSLVRLLDVSNKYQMKHLTTSQWYVTKTSQ